MSIEPSGPEERRNEILYFGKDFDWGAIEIDSDMRANCPEHYQFACSKTVSRIYRDEEKI